MEKLHARRLALLIAPLGIFALNSGCATPPPPPETNQVIQDDDVRGCSEASLGDLGPLDVAVAIDTSITSMYPSGVDIDGDGAVGAIEESAYTDLGDSRLSAQVVALRTLLHRVEGQDVRFSIVTFSRSNALASSLERVTGVVSERDAKIRAPLTNDVEDLETALDEVLQDGGHGATSFYAGMRGANRSLIESSDPTRESRKVVLFLSDSPDTTRLDVDGTIKKDDERMGHAARQALRHRIIFNTFGLSADSDRWRRRSLGQIAGATSGHYHGVKDPQRLYCHLANALASSATGRSKDL